MCRKRKTIYRNCFVRFQENFLLNNLIFSRKQQFVLNKFKNVHIGVSSLKLLRFLDEFFSKKKQTFVSMLKK